MGYIKYQKSNGHIETYEFNDDVTQIYLGHKNIAFIIEINNEEYVKTLDLSFNEIISIKELDKLTQLQELILTFNKISSIV